MFVVSYRLQLKMASLTMYGTDSAAPQSNRNDALKWGVAAGTAMGMVVYFLATGSGSQTTLYSTAVKPVNTLPAATVPVLGNPVRVSATNVVGARPAARTQMDAYQTPSSFNTVAPVSQVCHG